MGIFNFFKEIGKKLADQGQANAANAPQALAQKLEQELAKMGLGIDAPKVRVEGDKAIIEGNARSQADVEKAVLAVGNTQGIAQVETRMNAPAAPASKFYTVQKGDTLSHIAKEFYGNANRYNEIFEANRPMLKNPDEIYPGQQLRIPMKENMAA